MEKKYLKKIKVSDEITLDVCDLSRVAAGDRCFVQIVIFTDVPIKKEYFNTIQDPDAAFDKAQKIFGPTIRYEYKRERIFIDTKVKDKVLKELLTIFKKDVLPYISRPDFFKKFVVSKYIDAKRDPYKYQKASN